MRGLNSWSGWQWLFLIEGIITGCVGVASWVMMPASPCQTAGRGRGKGWFNDREEKIMVNRLLRDDPSKGDMNNREAVSFKGLIKSFLDYDLWPTYLVSCKEDRGKRSIDNFAGWLHGLHSTKSTEYISLIYPARTRLQHL